MDSDFRSIGDLDRRILDAVRTWPFSRCWAISRQDFDVAALEMKSAAERAGLSYPFSDNGGTPGYAHFPTAEAFADAVNALNSFALHQDVIERKKFDLRIGGVNGDVPFAGLHVFYYRGVLCRTVLQFAMRSFNTADMDCFEGADQSSACKVSFPPLMPYEQVNINREISRITGAVPFHINDYSVVCYTLCKGSSLAQPEDESDVPF